MLSLFDENGLLDIDSMVADMPSFRNIMEDGIVTDEEIAAQSKAVVDLLHKVEESCTPGQLALFKEALAELSVLYLAYHYKQLQELK